MYLYHLLPEAGSLSRGGGLQTEGSLLRGNHCITVSIYILVFLGIQYFTMSFTEGPTVIRYQQVLVSPKL